MTIRLRRVLTWILIIFAIYAIFRSPEQAAGVTRDAFDGVAAAVRGVGRFFDALLGR